MSVKRSMESLDVYRNESDRLSDALKDAYERRDTKAARAILEAARILIRHLRLGLKAKYGTFRRSHALGAYKFKRPNWMGKTPQEVIDKRSWKWLKRT